jgi:hypothetical protein
MGWSHGFFDGQWLYSHRQEAGGPDCDGGLMKGRLCQVMNAAGRDGFPLGSRGEAGKIPD